MSTPAISVVVVSRGRPRHLSRCLTGLAQLFHRPFEVVIAADEAGRDAVAAHPMGARVKLLPNDTPGISVARNRAVARASAEIVAFIDDDAVPEPTWLCHLTEPFRDPSVGAATGYVIGRNGISLQWAGRLAAADASVTEIDPRPERPWAHPPGQETAVMLEGTNMAIRREVLARLGGFDARYRFYLDDTDLSLRLSAAGHAAVVVPDARVHHAFAESDTRRADRAPRDLFDIGRSLGVFLALHAPELATEALRRETLDQRRRLLRMMVDGLCEPRDVGRLLASFERGVSAAESAGAFRPERFPDHGTFRPLHPTPERPGAGSVQVSRWRSPPSPAAATTRTVFRFDPTARFHKVRFTDDGVWRHTGGQFGRASRGQSLIRWSTMQDRVREEISRVAVVRGLTDKGVGEGP